MIRRQNKGYEKPYFQPTANGIGWNMPTTKDRKEAVAIAKRKRQKKQN